MPRTKFPDSVKKQAVPDRFNLTPTTSIDELGVAGAKISSGFVHDEFLVSLIGRNGRRVYRQMRDNDATVGAVVFAVEMLLRAVEWNVSISDEVIDTPEAEDSIEFLEGVLFDDMSHTWDDFISTVLSFLQFGWQYTEVIYKLRMGPDNADPSKRSIFEDGAIGIRKLADRSQETLDRWEVDERGNVKGMWQEPPNGGSSVTFIPIEKALLFRPHQHKGSPEGRSILRNAYRPWFFLKNIQEIESIAIERELNGLPVIYIPNEILTSTDDNMKQIVQSYIKMVRDIKFNEQGGVVLPSNPFMDQEGNPVNLRQVELQLLNAQGTRAIDTDKTVLRYQQDIARTILADFIMLGAGDRGSFALSNSKTELFARALEGWLESIATTVNRHMVPRLWQLNGFDMEYMPYLVPGKVAPEDLDRLGTFVQRLAQAGAPLFPDDDLENSLRDAAGLPEKSISDDLIELTGGSIATQDDSGRQSPTQDAGATEEPVVEEEQE